MPLTLCECAAAGYCPRHRCVKTPHWHQLCQRRADYFQLWEESHGPGQNLPPPRDLSSACRHRGEVSREQSCPSCRGLVRLKVFACALHGECTIGRPLADVACCASCGDFAPVVLPADPPA
jgi:hypothetical protein